MSSIQKAQEFFVAVVDDNSKSKQKDGKRNEIKRKSIALRPELMKFPGSRRIHNAKTENDQEFVVVIRVKKSAKGEIEIPEEFGGLMKLDKEAKRPSEAGVLGEYELNDKSGRVQLKLFKMKIKALRTPKFNPKRLKGSGSTTKTDADATPEEAKKIPAPSQKTTEETPLTAPSEAELARFARIEKRTEIYRKSISMRPKLMKFPGARRMHRSKTENDQEFVIVLRVAKSAKGEVELPEEFGDIMKLDKEAKRSTAGVLGEYELNDKSGRVQVKSFKAMIKSLRTPKRNPKRMKGSGSTTETDADATPEEAKKIPAPSQKTSEETPLTAPATTATTEAPIRAPMSPGSPKSVIAGGGSKADKRNLQSPKAEDAPTPKRAKVEDTAASDAASAAVC